jgi:hypothetical protein
MFLTIEKILSLNRLVASAKIASPSIIAAIYSPMVEELPNFRGAKKNSIQME